MHARKLQDQVTLLEMKLKSLTFVDIQLLKPLGLLHQLNQPPSIHSPLRHSPKATPITLR